MMNQRPRGTLKLGVIMSAIAIVWLQILPWVAVQPAIAAHLQHLDEQGIDPSAMFYTDLDAMEPILRRLERH